MRLATGASGVGFASSLGLALAAVDSWPNNPPRVHIVEGEGGLTPGRVAEALAFGGDRVARNAIVHLDWNQASIDSDHVTREGDQPGDYVQWDPRELFYLHDWNVIDVADGFSFPQIFAAQKRALEVDNGQPVAIVYRTTKGWKYGIEGSASHGAGHKLCSAGFFDAVQPLVERIEISLPACEPGITRCGAGSDPSVVESCFWESLTTIRKGLAKETRLLANHTGALREARSRLSVRGGIDSKHDVNEIFALAQNDPATPPELALEPGSSITLRGQLGKVLGYYNRASRGSIFIAAADLLDSTSISEISKGFAERLLQREVESRLAHPLGRRHLRGRDERHPLRRLVMGTPHRRRIVLRRLHRAAQPHRRAPPCDREPGPPLHRPRTLPHDDRHLRPRRPQDRRGRPHARRSPAAAAPAGELPGRVLSSPSRRGIRRRSGPC